MTGDGYYNMHLDVYFHTLLEKYYGYAENKTIELLIYNGNLAYNDTSMVLIPLNDKLKTFENDFNIDDFYNICEKYLMLNIINKL